MITTLHEIFIFRVLVVKPELYPRVDENKVITETAETQSTNHPAANTVSQSVSLTASAKLKLPCPGDLSLTTNYLVSDTVLTTTTTSNNVSCIDILVSRSN